MRVARPEAALGHPALQQLRLFVDEPLQLAFEQVQDAWRAGQDLVGEQPAFPR